MEYELVGLKEVIWFSCVLSPALDRFVASTRVTKEMMDAIDKILETGNYLRVSDYLRDLIRNDLKSRGVSP